MNKYVKILDEILEKKSDMFRYPGELLERCMVDFPLEVDEVYSAFVDAYKDLDKRDKLVGFENAYNSDQLDKFVEALKDYRGENLRTIFTGEVRGIQLNKITTVDEYFEFLEYVDRYSVEDTEFVAGVFYKIKLLYGYSGNLPFSCTKVLAKFLGKYKVPKAESRFVKILLKSCEDVLKENDVVILGEYGYNELSAKRLNVNNMRSSVVGRKDRVVARYVKQCLFGSVPCNNEDQELVERLKEWEFQRAVDGYRRLSDMIDDTEFSTDSANVGLAEVILADSCYSIKHFRRISKNDSVYKMRSNEARISITINKLKGYDTDFDSWFVEFRHLTDDLALLGSAILVKLYTEDKISDKDVLGLPNDMKEDIFRYFFLNVTDKSVTILKLLMDGIKGIDGRTVNLFDVKGNNLSVDVVKEVYQLKEDFFYRNVPSRYREFIVYSINNTDEIIYTKQEWKQLLPLFTDTDDVLRAVSSEEEWDLIQKERQIEDNKRYVDGAYKSIIGASCMRDVCSTYRWDTEHEEVYKLLISKILENKWIGNQSECYILRVYKGGLLSDSDFLQFFSNVKESSRKEFE